MGLHLRKMKMISLRMTLVLISVLCILFLLSIHTNLSMYTISHYDFVVLCVWGLLCSSALKPKGIFCFGLLTA